MNVEEADRQKICKQNCRMSLLAAQHFLWLFMIWPVLSIRSTYCQETIVVVHDFTDSLRPLLDAIGRVLSNQSDGISLIYEELQVTKHFTGSDIFSAGEKLRDKTDTAVVIGPSRSGDVLLLHPHIVLMNVPHIAPVASDPAFDALDRFPQLIRMQKTYRFQINAILDVVVRMNWSTLAILSSESDYAHHAGERLREAAEKKGVKVLLNRRLADLTGELAVKRHLDDIRRIGQRVILIISEPDLAREILSKAVSNGMTGDGWAWLLWSDVADEMVITSDTTRHLSQRRWSTPRDTTGLPQIPGLLAFRSAVREGALRERFIAEYMASGAGPNVTFPNRKQMKYVDSVLAAAYGIAKGREISRGGGQSRLFDDILDLDKAQGVTGEMSFDCESRLGEQEARYEILNSKSGGRWWKIGTWRSANSSQNSSLSLSVDKLTLPGGQKRIASYLPQLKFHGFQIVTIKAEPFVIIKYNQSMDEQAEGSVVNKEGIHFSGFCIELLKALQSDLDFEYTIRDLGPGGKFGSRNPISGYWDGLIGELVVGTADLIVAPLTVTEERATVVDLTGSFMETELKFSINRDAMIGVDESNDYMRFSFLRPFHRSLWFALGISILAMALYLTFVSRLSPFGTHGRYFQSERGAESCARLSRRRSSVLMHPQEMLKRRNSLGLVKTDDTTSTAFSSNRDEKEGNIQSMQAVKRGGSQTGRRVSFSNRLFEPQACDDPAGNMGRRPLIEPKKATDDSESDDEEAQERENARRFMSFSNALYFACAGLMWQSPECVPRAPSARVAASIWNMVGVVIVASYTANMVAFVTQTSASSHLDSLEALIDQRIISPGTVASSSVDSLLMTSNLDAASALYKEMLRHPETSLQPDVESALNMTNKGELAFVWEGAPLEYAAIKGDCKLSTISLGFGKASYAFALRRESIFTDVLNRQLLKFRQTGFLEQLTQKYFGETCESSAESKDDEETYDRLTYSSLSGVFIMVAVAAAVSVLVLILEWVVACLGEIDRTNPKRPSDFISAARIRYGRLKLDFYDNWLPFKNIRAHWSKFRPVAVKPVACDIQPDQWKRFTPTPGSEKLQPGESISNPDLNK